MASARSQQQQVSQKKEGEESKIAKPQIESDPQQKKPHLVAVVSDAAKSETNEGMKRSDVLIMLEV